MEKRAPGGRMVEMDWRADRHSQRAKPRSAPLQSGTATLTHADESRLRRLDYLASGHPNHSPRARGDADVKPATSACARRTRVASGSSVICLQVTRITRNPLA
jgi:hypothetical protein